MSLPPNQMEYCQWSLVGSGQLNRTKSIDIVHVTHNVIPLQLLSWSVVRNSVKCFGNIHQSVFHYHSF